LILPVVICLSQRLSHACLSTSLGTQRNCEWLIKSVMVPLIAPPYLDNCGNPRANTCRLDAPRSRERRAFIRTKTDTVPVTCGWPGFLGEFWINWRIARPWRRRRLFRVSALSTFDGTLCVYRGGNG